MFKDIKIGDKTTETCLIKKAEDKEAKNGSKYVALRFTDGESEIQANLWDASTESIDAKEGQVVDVTLKCQEYQEQKSYVVERIAVSENQDVDKYIRHAPIPEDYMFRAIISMTGKMPEDLKAVTQHILKKHADEYKTAPGSMMVHHAYKSGLIYHVFRMLRNAQTVVKTYGLNAALVASGIILHDVGKLYELKTDTFYNPSYTTEGYGLGHTAMGVIEIDRAMHELGLEETENLMLLKNIVASHHFIPEHGALSRPICPEAVVVAMLDNMDAKVTIMEENKDGVEEGECSARIRYLDNTVVYVPIREKKEKPADPEKVIEVLGGAGV